MRYIALLKAAPPSSLPPPGLMEAIGKLDEEATKAGVLVDTAGLAPSVTRARVAVGKDITVTDGPLTGAGEPSSYALYEVRDKGRRSSGPPASCGSTASTGRAWEGTADVLKVMGPEDFTPPAS
jgi:hypothetical protein